MKDPRYKKLAENLICYSTELKKGEKILIEVNGCNNLLARELVKKVYEVGGIPFVKVNDEKLNSTVYQNCSEEQLQIMCENQLAFMKQMDAYLGIRESRNIYESSVIPSEKQSLISKTLRPVLDERVNNTKWCVMRYPNESFAQLAGMSTDDFEDFYFNVCNLDYSKMSKAMDNLIELMEKTDKVRIVGPGTDLTFSIKGIPAIKCDGKMNIPEEYRQQTKNVFDLWYYPPTIKQQIENATKYGYWSYMAYMHANGLFEKYALNPVKYTSETYMGTELWRQFSEDRAETNTQLNPIINDFKNRALNGQISNFNQEWQQYIDQLYANGLQTMIDKYYNNPEFEFYDPGEKFTLR
jgi:hypothetical protein